MHRGHPVPSSGIRATYVSPGFSQGSLFMSISSFLTVPSLKPWPKRVNSVWLTLWHILEVFLKAFKILEHTDPKHLWSFIGHMYLVKLASLKRVIWNTFVWNSKVKDFPSHWFSKAFMAFREQDFERNSIKNDWNMLTLMCNKFFFFLIFFLKILFLALSTEMKTGESAYKMTLYSEWKSAKHAIMSV